MEELDDEGDLEAAILEANTLDNPCYAALARKHKCDYITLSRRHRGVTISKAEATSIYKKILINAQKETLLQDIESLSKLYLYLISRILQNTIE
jgi:hypothetical protein